MTFRDPRHARRKPTLLPAIAGSVLLHALVLFLSPRPQEQIASVPAPLRATLAQRALQQLPTPPASTANPAKARKSPVSRAKPRLSSPARPAARRESVPPPETAPAPAEDMNRFLRELEARPRATPSLAERSLAMARESGRQQAQRDEQRLEMLERVPDSPPPDSLSLEFYLDSLLKKLNRSAAFVRNDPRRKGVKTGAVMVRLNPDGSMRSFDILYTADQEDEIAYIRSVVERALPFAAMPADLRRSLRSLALMICVVPPSTPDGGVGFTRRADGRGC